MSAAPTRRGLLTTAAAGAALAVAIPAADHVLAVGADADLLAACAEYHRAHAQWMDDPWASEARNNELNDARHETLLRVIALHPGTPEGLKVKAGVALSAMMFEVDHTVGADWRKDAEVEQIIAVDVLRGMAGELAA